MNNRNDKKADRVAATVDRLRGFDSRRLQCEMTDGLAEWHRRRAEGVRNRRPSLRASEPQYPHALQIAAAANGGTVLRGP